MKKVDKKVIALFIIIFIVPIVCLILSLLIDVPKQKEEEKHKEELLNLVNENIIDFKSYDFSSEKEFKYKYKPSNIENVLLIHLKKDKWSIYSTYGLTLREIKTKEDLNKIDVIAFAVSDFYSNTYKYNGSGTKVEISTEKVNIYLYNPKEDKLFIHRTLPYHELPKTTNTSRDYTHSVDEIKSTIKKALGIKDSSIWMGVLGILIIVVIIIVVIFGIRNFIKSIKKDNVNKNLNMKNKK
jgi:hypothetical protein